MKYFVILILFPLGLFAQDTTAIKSGFKKPTWDEETIWQNRFSVGYCEMMPGQSAEAPYHQFQYGYFDLPGALMLSNSVIRNFKQNPISLIADLSVAQGSFWMSVMDTARLRYVPDSSPPMKRSGYNYRVKNLTLVDIGIGAEIEGQYFFADIQYRIGYLSGGTVEGDSIVDITIIRNGKLNIYDHIYQGLQVGAGFRFKGFHLRVNTNLPLTRFQINMYKDWECSLSVSSITVGYTWSFGEK